MTSPAEVAGPADASARASVGMLARAAVAIGSHTVVDFFSTIIIPVMSVLEGRVGMSHTQGAALIGISSLTSGLIQPVVAWATDRLDTRWLGTLGFMIAVLAISLVGHATTFWQLMLIQALGSAGSGAFHPVAAAVIGQLSGRRRSRGVSFFYVAGMAGSIVGATASPAWARSWGLESMTWLIIPGLASVALLAWATHAIPHRSAHAARDHGGRSVDHRRGAWRAVGMLYAGNVLRFTVNVALVQLLIRWTEMEVLARSGAAGLTPELRQSAAGLNGPLHAAMALGMAISGLTGGMFLRAHHERAVLIGVPVAGAVVLGVFPLLTRAAGAWPGGADVAAFGLCLLSGAGFGGVIPLTISLAQRLLPHRTGMASGLMMGGAWSIAAAGPMIAAALLHLGGLDTAFVVVAASGAVSVFLDGRAADGPPRP